MKYLTISTSRNENDLYLDDFGNLAMSEDIEALSFITLNSVRTVRGELIFNADFGVPYFTTIFASANYIGLWEFYVRETALQIPGNTSISSFIYEVNGDQLSYEMVIATDSGKEVTIYG